METLVAKQNTWCTLVPHPPLTSNHPHFRSTQDPRHLDMVLSLLPNLLETDQHRLAHGVTLHWTGRPKGAKLRWVSLQENTP